ncbi:MAG: GDYXXLXY domain-containing protein [Planctomycetia bacterium]|nr:GDYXXLXY domain-containing protein [Planctomycetia bacterium]
MSDAVWIPSPESVPTAPSRIDRVFAFLKARQKLVLFAGVALQAIVLVAMVVLHALPYLVGERIVLKVVPVDPRDLFRGDYVVLSYDANRPPPEGIDGIPQAGFWWHRRWDSEAYLEDRTVYVSIEPDADGSHWHATKYSTERPASGKFLRGLYSRSNFQAPIKFGIEAFYVEEGHGKSLEELRSKRQLAAEIAVAPWGQAKLVRLIEE